MSTSSPAPTGITTPLSLNQKALYTLYRLVPDTSAYNLAFATDLPHADSERLVRAVHMLVRRHASLRTAFLLQGEQPVQCVCTAETFQPAVHDARDWSEEAVDSLLNQQANLPFDLAQGSCRASILQRRKGVILLLVIHHLAADFWTMQRLTNDLGSLYTQPDETLPEAAPYADHVVTQTKWIAGDEGLRLQEWWRQHLPDELPVLDLPTDRPRPPRQGFRGQTHLFEIPASINTKLHQRARSQGNTPYHLILAAWGLLLGRHAGQEEVVVGTPDNGRKDSAFRRTAGYFANPLPLVLRPGGNQLFSDYLKQTAGTVQNVLAHRMLPFQTLIEQRQRECDPSRAPLFQTMLAYLNVRRMPGLADFALHRAGGVLDVNGLQMITRQLEMRGAQMDLTLHAYDGGKQRNLVLGLEYDRALFDKTTILRLADHLTRLLTALADGLDLPLNQLPPAYPEAFDAVHKWETCPIPHRCIHELVHAQAKCTPNKRALVYGETQWSYGELKARADVIAAHLQQRGLGPESRVGICMSRTPDLIASLLAVLQIGGAYVPMDPAYPADRIRTIIDDAKAPLVLSQSRLDVPDHDGETLLVDQLPSIETAPPPRVLPEQLAYVIYTSGSTGRPKGVAITHHNAVAMLAWAQQQFSQEELAGTLAATSICFDLSIFEIFLPLSVGGAIYLAENAVALPHLPRKDEVTLINTVPSAVAELVNQKAIPAAVRTVNMAGEPLTQELADAVYTHTTATRVNDLYGPSEDTTYSTWTTRQQGGPVTVGKPIANTRGYVLDPYLRPVVPGAPGELYLSGEGVTRGYLGQPAMTAERYQPDPFANRPGARMYRTGDRLRQLSDGNLVFLGRVDHQIKLRGFRIELDEIRACLTKHPEVADAVVIVRDEALVAYVTGSSRDDVADRLRAHVRAHLPAYMTPTAVVTLQRFPLLPNGKLDRKSLPAPHRYVSKEPPQGETEALLAELWCEVLGQESLGRHDDFFALGGHSLTAVRLLGRITTQTGVTLDPGTLFAAPTIASLARHLANKQDQPVQEDAVPITDGPVPLSFAQRRMWFLYQLDPESPAYNLPAPLRLDGPLDVAVLHRALLDLVTRHQVLRTVYRLVDNTPVQIVEQARPVFASIDLQGQPEALDGIVRQESLRPFDLAMEQPLRVLVLRLTPTRHLLLMNIHHIATDAWSNQLMLHEMQQHYHRRLLDTSDALPALPLQYAQYAHRQNHRFSDRLIEKQLAFWRDALDGAPDRLQMTTDMTRDRGPRLAGGMVTFRMDAAVMQPLRALSQRHGATVFMTMLGIWGELLQRYSNQDEVVVGVPVAGRHEVDVQALVGFFVNMLPIRLTAERDHTAEDLVRATRAQMVQATTHQDIPFDLLVEKLVTTRDTSRTPLFQTIFQLGEATEPMHWLGGLRIEPQLPVPVAKFDLAMALTDSGDALLGELTYDANLFHHESMERLVACFQRLAAGVGDQPHVPLSALNMLDHQDKARLLRFSLGTGAPAGGTLHGLFLESLARDPNGIALKQADQTMTYAAMWTQARRISAALSAGQGSGGLVGLCGDLDMDLCVAQLGIMAAGLGYVPLPASYPDERLHGMMQDCDMAWIVVQPKQAERMATIYPQARLILLDDTLPSAMPAEDLPAPMPEGPAYAIFTSGSTGKPKGVLITHGSVTPLFRWTLHHMNVGPQTKMLHYINFAFDVNVYAAYTVLGAGGTLCLLDPGEQPDPMVASETCLRQGVNAFFGTPSFMERMMEVAPNPAISLFGIGGEAVTWQHMDALIAGGCAHAEVWDIYGPTEAAICNLCPPVPTRTENRTPTVLLSYPTGNGRIYIVDRFGKLTPIGVPGELLLGGPLPPGYLKRPAMTGERYIPDAFSGEPGARLYRTGDLSRYLPNGQIEYLGRTDHQVKIRGYRIELDEIRAHLEKMAQVAGAVVAARGETDKRLVAYVVPAEEVAGNDDLTDTLCNQLRKEVPEWMVPTVFLYLDTFPYNRSDKVDVKALNQLPLPDVAAATYTPPRNATETSMAEIWREVLDVDKVGAHANFFSLGGHSLLATRLLSRVNQRFGCNLALRTLFEAPTLAALCECITPDEAPDTAPLPVLDHQEGRFPASFAQRRLWLLDQVEKTGAAYHIPLVLSLSGNLQVSRLEAALNTIIARHGSLRTTFAADAAEVTQEVHPFTPHTLKVTRATEHTEVDAWVEAENQIPFDLTKGPLIRASLLRLAPNHHLLMLNQHHIISDGWSIGVMSQELEAAYHHRQLPPLSLQYTDFSAWQHHVLSGQNLQRQVDFWRRHLKGAPALLDLPTDKPRPPVVSYRGDVHHFALSPKLRTGLEALAHRSEVSLYMLLLSVYAVLLQRHAQVDDLVIGTPVANRQRPELEGIIGFFVNTLALRLNLSGAPSFSDLMTRVRDTTLDAFHVQDLPFEHLVEVLQPPRNPAHTPIFQHLFVYQNLAMKAPVLDGLRCQVQPAHTTTAKFDLTCVIMEEGDGLTASLEYSTDLFLTQTIAGMAQRFLVLLEAVVARPQTPIDALPLMSARQRRAILALEDPAQAHPDRNKSIPQLVAERAAEQPDSIAISSDNVWLSYRELIRRANQLAHFLQAHGVGPETPVGICLPREAETYIAYLAVLTAGGLYVPLDPDYPPERLTFMMQDSGITHLLTDQRGDAALPQGSWQRIRPGSIHRNAIAAESTDAPRTTVLPEQSAHVIYTSGSTGLPKGVRITHRGVSRLTRQIDFLTMGPQQVVGQIGSFSFDASTWEIWTCFTNGARLAMFPAGSLSLADIGEVLQRFQITTVLFTAGLFHQLVDHELHSLSGVRQLISGGDVLAPDHARRVLQGLPNTTLINAYGPTENTVMTTTYRMNTADQVGTTTPIGYAVTGTQLLILDANLEPVPAGIPGEMWTAGPGLARDYVNQPALTADRFRPNPHSNTPGERMYRIGDFGRTLPTADGRRGPVVFLGRHDNQVKLRGFRIELGEIENALNDQPGIAGAVVLLRTTAAGDQQLASYLLTDGEVPRVEDLKAGLRHNLPQWMLPTVYHFMDAFPLDPNGKIDRRRLLSLDVLSEDTTEAVPPRNPREEVLVAIWSDLLDRDTIGVTDNFFELGGHSLLATRVVVRIRESLGVELPVRALFDAPTIADLALMLRDAEDRPKPPPIQPWTGSTLPPASFAQQRMWFMDRWLGPSGTYNIPVALRLKGPFDLRAIDQALQAVVRRHPVLATRFEQDEADDVRQVVCDALTCPLTFIDLGTEVHLEALVKQEAARPFQLDSGRMFRATVFRISDRDHLLLLNMHHIASDGWSLGVLMDELAQGYQNFLHNKAPDLPALPVSYADFASWQRDWLSGPVQEHQLAFWREKLDGAPALLELPTDKPRPATLRYQGAAYDFRLEPGLTAGLKQQARQEGVSLYMLLLAGYATLLHRHSDMDDIVIGTPVANRVRPELEPLIGFFVNTLALRFDLADRPDFAALTAQVRNTALDAFAHQDLPFEQLVEHLKPERNPAHTPLFQVLFVLQNNPLVVPHLPGLHCETPHVDSGAAKFDLSLAVMEQDDGLTASFEYNTDLFEATTMADMAARFTTLLQAAVADPTASIDVLPLLTPAQRKALLTTEDPAAQHPDRRKAIHEMVAEHAAANPDSTAVSGDGVWLTYRTLVEHANQLANTLREYGVRQETPVGVCLPRAAETVVAYLAVLTAGGCYVPLDPNYPSERLEFMLRDTGIQVLLTDRERETNLPAGPWQRIYPKEDHRAAIAAQPTEAPRATFDPDQIANIIFTSGSTGRPKGVRVPHRCVARLVRHDNYLNNGPNEVFGQYVSFSFDVSTFELWSVLTNGGRMAVFPAGILSLAEIGDFIQRQRITVQWLTSGLFHQMVDHELDKLHGVPQIMSGGDVLAPAQVTRLLNELPNTTLINGYGPTENTTYTTCYRMDSADQIGATVPIGYSINGTNVTILDGNLEPTPRGVPGELWASGPGVSRDYLNRPAMTADRYRPNPHATTPGERMYRIGDFGRWLPDVDGARGPIEFLGRRDNQVKLRGFRIELGEVEVALGEISGVAQAVALIRSGPAGEKQLAAFILADNPGLTPDDVKAALRDSLPAWMQPTLFHFMDSFPLNPNGKVDRRKLAALEIQQAAGEEKVAPRTDAERALALIWQDVLDIRDVGVTDNFFDLGGHSLLATRIVSRVAREMKADLPLRALFDSPTIAQQAEQLQSLSGATVITALPQDKPVPLSYAQERLWFLDQVDTGEGGLNIPCAVKLDGDLDREALQAALDLVIQRHQTLRTIFPTVEGRGLAEIQATMPLTIDWVALREDRTLHQVLNEEAVATFDLSRGPLLRATLIGVAPQQHILCLTLHHIIADGWSLGVLIRDLSAAYSALRRQATPQLPELPIQYGDYAAWQRDWLEGAVESEQLAWWRALLTNAPITELPTDRPRPKRQSYGGAAVTAALDAAARQALEALAAEHHASLFMVLLSAFKLVLSSHTGQTDITVGTPIAGRNREETEGLIGLFLNSMALRTDLGNGDKDKAPTFLDVLARLREVTLGAYRNQDVPFEKLLNDLNIPRDPSRTPLFQIFFNLLNLDWDVPAMDGLTVNRTDPGDPLAKFDLTVYVDQDRPGLFFNFVYNPALFNPETMDNLLEQYLGLLQQIVENPDHRIDEYTLMTARSLAVLPDLNAPLPRVEVPLFFEKLAEHARLRPHATAVIDTTRSWTYTQLNARANKLANYLIGNGVSKGDTVSIYAQRNSSLAWMLPGIARAGAKFLILDPTYPPLRLAAYLRLADTRAFLVCAEAGHPPKQLVDVLDRIRCDCRPRFAVDKLDRSDDPLANMSETTPEISLGPDDPASLVFTSGTTGLPKGVVGRHGGLVAILPWLCQHLSLDHNDRISMLSGIAHDPLQRDVLIPFFCGGTLVIPDPDEMRNPDRLARWMHTIGATLTNLTPALGDLLSGALDAPGATLPPLEKLRHALMVGAALKRSSCRRLRNLAPKVNIINLYGATETQRLTSYWTVPEDPDTVDAEIMPLGKASPGSQVFVQNRSGAQAGIGEVGEIYFRGKDLALGYLDPEQTAERFLPNPHTQDPTDRLYKTGDVGRTLPNGDLVFAGRNDRQIKVRGFRIELAEIEAALDTYPPITDAVVRARDDKLIAWLVPKPDTKVITTELRAFLAERLPPFMIPSVFPIIDKVPLTPNGKLDEKALPAPEEALASSAFTLPETEAEEKVAAVFAEILHLQRVGRHDNFFTIGGTSVLAVQTVYKLRQVFGGDLPVMTLFEHPTPEELARKLAPEQAEPEKKTDPDADLIEARRAKAKDRGRRRRR